MAITLSVSEEIWVRNIINVFVAPVSPFELREKGYLTRMAME